MSSGVAPFRVGKDMYVVSKVIEGGAGKVRINVMKTDGNKEEPIAEIEVLKVLPPSTPATRVPVSGVYPTSDPRLKHIMTDGRDEAPKVAELCPGHLRRRMPTRFVVRCELCSVSAGGWRAAPCALLLAMCSVCTICHPSDPSPRSSGDRGEGKGRGRDRASWTCSGREVVRVAGTGHRQGQTQGRGQGRQAYRNWQGQTSGGLWQAVCQWSRSAKPNDTSGSW